MEGMGNVGRFEKRMHAVHGNTIEDLPEAPDSLQQIKDDPAQSKLFALYMDHHRKEQAVKDAYTRYESGSHTEKDEKLLEGVYEDFSQRKLEADKALETIRKWQSEVLRHSDAFRKFSDFKGLDKIEMVLDKGLPDMAMKNPKLFEKIKNEVAKLEALDQREKELDEKISKFCTELNVPNDDAFLDALNSDDESVRREAVRKLAAQHQGMRQGVFGGVGDWVLSKTGWFGGGSEGIAKRISSENLRQFIHNKHVAAEEFGKYAKTLLNKNAEFRKALSRANFDKVPTFVEGSEAKLTFAESKTEAGELTRAKTLERAADFKKTNEHKFKEAARLKKSRNPLDQAEGNRRLGALRSEFAGSEGVRYAKYEKKGGFWAELFVAGINAVFYNPNPARKGSLLNDPDIQKTLS